MYCFGYGLSYTSFNYSSLKTNKAVYSNNENIIATITLTNTGRYAGKETVQLYVTKKGSRVERAEKEMKGFKKVLVLAGQRLSVNIALPVKDLAYYDVAAGKWVVEPGKYLLLAGGSSRDIKEVAAINILP